MSKIQSQSHNKLPIEPADLKRSLTWWPLFCIVVANTIGTGIFTTSGFMMADLQNPFVMIACWALGGMLALAGALCYAELGSMFPQDGGDYVFLKESFGKTLAFLSGWISLWVGFSAPIAASSMAFGQYFSTSFTNAVGIPMPPKILAVFAIIVFSLIHHRGLTFGANLQNALSSAKICCIVGLILFGLFWGNGSWSHFEAPDSFSSFVSPSFASALIFVSFAYSGWNAAAYLGGEVKNPEKNLPLSILLGTLCVIVIYILLNITFVYALGTERMSGVEEVGEVAASALFGPSIGSLFGFLIAFFLLSAVSAMIMTGPRVYYAMARDKLFFKWFADVDKDRHVPGHAIVLQATIAIAMVMTSTFYTLLIYIGFVLSIFASLTVAGSMRLRRRNPELLRPYKTWGYPITPILFITLNIWIIVFSIKNNPSAFIWGLVTILSGLVMYQFFNHHNKGR